ncbi:hypothetical protein [Simiduia aestuariiviva]|uniref:Uncharacterized protein n=1 Tax=Simiduia aestuariiviva TaxID=1510459 RepID=A0A839UMD1_9GAMM|nr:hypothetical protein [Simiduia aestuariiviva]MBB3169012.1 hypothetical protein [Simiduia aestuariiviva]
MSEQHPQEVNPACRADNGCASASTQAATARAVTLSFWQKAACGLLIVGLAVMGYALRQNWQRAQLTEALTTELVALHLAQQPLEFTANSLDELDPQFAQLDFTLVDSIQLPALNDQLLGGRYSDVLGHTAAQLRLAQGNQWRTLFQLPFHKGGFAILGNIHVDERPLLRFARGLQVTVWEENGVLLALVQVPDTEAGTLEISKPQLPAPPTSAKDQ